jgi:branched-chain amino acid transport system substrate-binding protein
MKPKNSRHCNPVGRSILNPFAVIFLLIISFLFPIHQTFSQSTIKIGFLIRDKNDLAVQQTAELAIQEANAKGGYKGKKFELIVKSCDGPWGMTSKQAVALIYDEQAPMVVTALDGRNAHLAEQVTAKSHVVMLSTLSSDPTLSRAYVPWYFRMVPDDRQQAEALVEQIYEKGKAKKVAVVSFDDYDGKMSAEAFTNKAKEKNYPVPEVFVGLKENELFARINDQSWDALVLAGSSNNTATILRQVKAKNIYAFVNLTNFMQDYQPALLTKLKYVNMDMVDQQTWEKFDDSYQQKFNAHPSPSVAFVYDGLLLAVEAIRRFGPDSEAIRKGFKDLKYQGITGNVEFGKLGNRELNLLVD